MKNERTVGADAAAVATAGSIDALKLSHVEPSLVPICGNCRHHEIDEHGGGRNRCGLLEESERYKYAVNHTCDTAGTHYRFAFEPDCFQLEGLLEQLRQRYHELIYEVVKVYPGETRHETARRIIRQNQAGTSNQASATKIGSVPSAAQKENSR